MNAMLPTRNALLFTLVVSLLLVAFVVKEAHACSCVASSLEEQLQRADAVFSGEVVNVEEDYSTSPSGGPPLLGPVTFKVEESWKGVSKEPVVVHGYGEGGGDCSIQFREGKQYLVYAQRSGRDGDGPLQTGICSGTKPLAVAREDLEALASMGSTVSGSEGTLPESGGAFHTGSVWRTVTPVFVVAAPTALLLLGALAARRRRG